MHQLNCTLCRKDMGVIRDGKVRGNMVVYCAPCNAEMRRVLNDSQRGERASDLPDILHRLFGARK